ncbi:MAG: signal peptidase I [Clostridia bacterium]|nr:signal peptidase I [Clostridia bacterium]
MSQNEPSSEVSAVLRIFSVLSTVVVYLLAACILIGAILFAFNASPTKSIFGYRYYTVLTPSMSPNYNVGDVIFVHIEDSDTINEGDVITFNPSADSEAYLTHRVTEKIENYEGTGVTCFRTKGDANNSEDSFLIDEEKVIGKVVFGIPKLGYIIRFAQLRWYYIAAITVMIIAFIYLLKRYFKAEDENGGQETEAAEGAGEVSSEKTD